MSEKIDAESGKAENTESGGTETQFKADRSAEEYAARLVEVSAENKKFRESNKALKAQMDELSSKFNKLNEDRMKEQGNYQEAWTKTKAELDAEREARKREKQAYAYKVVSSQLESEAAKTGCLNPQAFVKVAKADGLINDLEVNEEFEIDPNSLKTAMEKAQKEYSFLFGKPTPSVRDGVPSGNQQPKPLQKNDLVNQPMEKLLEMAKRLQ